MFQSIHVFRSSFFKSFQAWLRQEIVDDDPWDTESLFTQEDWDQLFEAQEIVTPDQTIDPSINI